MVLKKLSEGMVNVLWSLCKFSYDQILDSSIGKAIDLAGPWSRDQFPL